MNIITRLITQSDNAILREEMSRLLTGLFKGEIDPKDVFRQRISRSQTVTLLIILALFSTWSTCVRRSAISPSTWNR